MRYNLKALDEYTYPSGYREYVFREAIKGNNGKNKGRKGLKANEVNYKNKEKNIYKIKKKMRRYALINDLTRMVTINTQECITANNVDVFDYYFKQFLKYLKRKYPKYKDIKYLGSRELQDRGALHIHFLINMYIPQDIADKIWNQVAGKGHVDIRYKGIQAINYVIKYISKGLMETAFTTEEGFSKKAYFMSKNLDRNLDNYKKTVEYIEYQETNGDIKIIGFKGKIIKNIMLELEEQKNNIVWDRKTEYEIKGVVYSCRSILISQL